jgi:hypothetical protein
MKLPYPAHATKIQGILSLHTLLIPCLSLITNHLYKTKQSKPCCVIWWKSLPIPFYNSAQPMLLLLKLKRYSSSVGKQNWSFTLHTASAFPVYTTKIRWFNTNQHFKSRTADIPRSVQSHKVILDKLRTVSDISKSYGHWTKLWQKLMPSNISALMELQNVNAFLVTDK